MKHHELGKLTDRSTITFTDATGAQWRIAITEQGISVDGTPHGVSRIAVHPSSHASVEITNTWKERE